MLLIFAYFYCIDLHYIMKNDIFLKKLMNYLVFLKQFVIFAANL